MNLNESQLFSMIQQLKVEDPILKDLLRQFVSRFQDTYSVVFPPETAAPEQEDAEGTSNPPADITSFTYTLLPLGIKFEWNKPSSDIILFEIRKGNTWDTASRQLVTSTLSAVLDGQTIGTHKYWIKGQKIDGTYSANALSVDVLIPAIGPILINGSVIDNFVLLSWSAPTSAFQLQYYRIYRDGSVIGTTSGTLMPVFENTSGTYQYGIQAVDIIGNESTISTKDFIVNQPPDYVLEDLETDNLNGTHTNTLRDPELPSLFACVDLTETWLDYAANGYATLQDEIDAGLPYWLQPTLATGEYETVIDYGAVFDGVICNIDWNYNPIVPTMQVECFLSTSLDNVTFTAESNTVSLFSTSMRYLKIRLVFTALN